MVDKGIYQEYIKATEIILPLYTFTCNNCGDGYFSEKLLEEHIGVEHNSMIDSLIEEVELTDVAVMQLDEKNEKVYPHKNENERERRKFMKLDIENLNAKLPKTNGYNKRTNENVLQAAKNYCEQLQTIDIQYQSLKNIEVLKMNKYLERILELTTA